MVAGFSICPLVNKHIGRWERFSGEMMVQNDDGHADVFRLLYGLLGGYTVIYGDEQTVWILFPYFFDNGMGETISFALRYCIRRECSPPPK